MDVDTTRKGGISLGSVAGTSDGRVMLSTLWLFATLNYLYCDILGLMDSEPLQGFLDGNVGGMEITQGFLLGGAILMEIPIAMVLLSRILHYGANRWANIAAGTIMTVVQVSSLFIETPTAYYAFFSAIEIACTAFVVCFAWTWRESSVIASR